MDLNSTQVYIENIGVGLTDIDSLYKLDMKMNEYLLVGERFKSTSNTIDNEYNLIVNNNGIGINCTRKELMNTNAGLLINNNIICNGTISAKNVKFDSITLDGNLTSQKLTELINKINSNTPFYEGYATEYNKNIYTPSYLTVGNYSATHSNYHPLKISDSPIGKTENIQLAIYNNINNIYEPAKLGIGMLGYNENSPANIYTSYGMPLEFHISKPSSNLDKLYEEGLGLPVYYSSNDPQLAIDVNGCVNIHKANCDIALYKDGEIKIPEFYVNGDGYMSNMYTYDYYTNSNLHLDEIYIRRNGLTLKANQIIGGVFAKAEYIFQSNLYIGSNLDNSYRFNLYGSANISEKLETDEIKVCKTTVNGEAEFNKITYFNNNTIFNDSLTINKSLNINNDLFINGVRLASSNFEYANNGLNYDLGCNLSISGRFGTGILNTDTYDNQFNIIKRNRERFEIYLEDKAGVTSDDSKVYIGHSSLNNLYGNIDNSLIFLTQKNIKWHNIYFYAGKEKDGCHGFKNESPNLSIMQNNRIGINTNAPIKTLDIIGECLANDYYIRKNNNQLKINNIIYNNTNNSILNVSTLDINLELNKLYENKRTLNISGGINSYDGYYENNLKITNFKNYGKISGLNDNIGIGINKLSSYDIPLQIRNTTSNINNNSIIRIYRGIRGGGFNNNAIYTGIDFCDFDMPLRTQNKDYYKWFIYKNHKNINDNTGVLQIGYTDNTYNPTHSAINFYYNSVYKKYFVDINNPNVNYNYDIDKAVSIKGNVEIEGSLNLKGANASFMINNIIVGKFINSNLYTNSNPTLNVNTNYTNDINDLNLLGNKITIFPNKTSVIAYKDEWIFNKLNNIEITNTFKSPLFVYNNNDYYDDVIPPVITKFYNKAFKNYNIRPDISIIELGIIDNNNDEGTIKHKMEFKVKGYDDIGIFEITPNNNYPFITCINNNNKNQINFGDSKFYTSNQILTQDSCINISDSFDYLLKLTNNTKSVKIGLLNSNNNIWDIKADTNFNLIYNNNKYFDIDNNGNIYIANNINSSSIKSLNTYTNSNSTSNMNLIINSYISTPYSNILREFKNIHDDNYDDLLDNNISTYKLYVKDEILSYTDIYNKNIYNYSINNSNIIYSSNLIINVNTMLSNVQIDYKYLDNINVDKLNNTDLISLIPTLRTYNPYLNAKIKTFDNLYKDYVIDNKSFNLIYKVPRTINNEIFIDSSITNSNFISKNQNNFYSNINIRSFVRIKDKPSDDYKIKTITNNISIIDNNSNYYYNATHSIYYYPVPNINVSDIEIDIKYTYNYRNEINAPTNFLMKNYNNTLNITTSNTNITLHNSNYFLSNVVLTNDKDTYLETLLFKKNVLISSNIVEKIYPIEINNVDIANIKLSLLKYNYYDIYDFNSNNPNIYLPVTINDYKPHISLNNLINSKLTTSHHLYSYNDTFEIHLEKNRLLSLDSNGNINTNGSINANNLIFTGDILYKDKSITSNLLNIIGNDFYITKNNISLNSSNIFLNPGLSNGGVIINGSDLKSCSNIFEINNYVNNDIFINLRSVSNSGYINIDGKNDTIKLGSINGNFGILKNNSNLLSFDNSNLINIDGNIKTSNHFAINDITTYIDNSYDYKMRVKGNIKVDGFVMSSSDKRIKKDIKKIENALDKIELLSGITFNKNGEIRRQTGLIAQDVQRVIPEAVIEDENGYLNIAYGNLMGLIIEGIKELRSEIKNIK